MKKTKILVVLILVLALVAMVFVGCKKETPADDQKTAEATQSKTDESTDKTTDEEEPTEPQEVENVVLYLVTFNNIPDNYDQINDAINEYIAQEYPDSYVSLEIKLFGPAEYQDKINLAMQSGTPLDIYIPLGIQTFIANNQCYPVEDLLDEYGQGIKDILANDFGDGAFEVFTKDGHIYGVPVNKGMVVTPTLTVVKEMLDATGFTMDDIKSIWDLPQVFDKVLELYPDAYPFAGTNQQDSGIMMILKGEQEYDTLSEQNAMGVVFKDSTEVVNLYESQQFYDYINLMRDWYNKGYMPKDMATSTTRATELWAADRLFGTWAGYGGDSIATTLSASTGKEIVGKWIAPFYMTTSDAGLAMAISSTTKVPEAAMKMLDIIYTDEFVINTILYGEEGIDYVKVDEHHWAYPEGLDANTVAYTAAYCTGVIGSESLQYQPVGVSYDDVLLKLQQNKDAKRSPVFGFSFDPSSVTNELTALQNVYDQYMPGLICGSLDPDTAIPEYVEALKEAGIEM